MKFCNVFWIYENQEEAGEGKKTKYLLFQSIYHKTAAYTWISSRIIRTKRVTTSFRQTFKSAKIRSRSINNNTRIRQLCTINGRAKIIETATVLYSET